MSKKTKKQSTLENEVGLPGSFESRLNEQARNGVECIELIDRQDLCLDSTAIDASKEVLFRSSLSPSPSFLVLNKDNVNSQIYFAKGLMTVWDFLEYKGRIGRTNILLYRKDDYTSLKIMTASCKSRYFDDGRRNMAYKIIKRFGRYKRVPGLMQTLTYDPKKIGKREAWASYSKDTRRFLNSINQYRKRRDWKRLHYFWIVEVQNKTGYPHVHIFFPKLKWLAPLNIINGNWKQGRANIESPKSLNFNCIGYICKYLIKMESWSNLSLALLWNGKCRMYGFSRGFEASVVEKETEWGRWRVVEARDIEQLEKILEEGGFHIENRAG
ncbi:hypothetical protein ACFLYS_02625 [Chloroflexota bacterium]